jgi:REP element-mobilizing transposase RayT
MFRRRKRHVQLELPKLDKNGQRRGGKRAGAGRPKKGVRASERHETRAVFDRGDPVHVIMRATADVGSLRKRSIMRAIHEATIIVTRHEARFRIIHLSLQRTHIHMIVEAENRVALATGMQAFGISAARNINREIGEKRGEKRVGRVFADRYHARILKTPRQVRNTIAYVLNNWRHHGEDKQPIAKHWIIDPFASGVAFTGWKERDDVGYTYRAPPGYLGFVVWQPTLWLLREGWKRWGLISVSEVPGGGPE